MRQVIPHKLFINDSTTLSGLNISINGKWFLETRALYLSASNDLMFDGISAFNPFVSGTSTQQISYPEFYGIEVLNFFVTNDKILDFQFPQIPKTSGFVEVISENEAGYGRLTIDSRLPFVSAYQGATDYQFPWTNGIEIVKT